jgi:hypothetical protein
MKKVSGSIALIKSDNLLSEYTSDKLRGFVYTMILPCKNKPRQTNSDREFSMECFRVRDSKSCFKCVDSNLLFITVYISGKVLSCKTHWEKVSLAEWSKRTFEYSNHNRQSAEAFGITHNIGASFSENIEAFLRSLITLERVFGKKSKKIWPKRSRLSHYMLWQIQQKIERNRRVKRIERFQDSKYQDNIKNSRQSKKKSEAK